MHLGLGLRARKRVAEVAILPWRGGLAPLSQPAVKGRAVDPRGLGGLLGIVASADRGQELLAYLGFQQLGWTPPSHRFTV